MQSSNTTLEIANSSPKCLMIILGIDFPSTFNLLILFFSISIFLFPIIK